MSGQQRASGAASHLELQGRPASGEGRHRLEGLQKRGLLRLQRLQFFGNQTHELLAVIMEADQNVVVLQFLFHFCMSRLFIPLEEPREPQQNPA